MNLKVKVCGMREPDNIAGLTKLNPDYIGFIFYSRSKRFVGNEFDPDIVASVPPNIKKVGVFVNAPLNSILETSEFFGLDYVQLHGNEPVDYCKFVFYAGIKIIKAFPVNGEFNFGKLPAYKPFCDFFLFDTQTSTFGGTGEKFDWEILNNYDNEKPLFLSGGISENDVGAIKKINGINIHAIDINSRFEDKPGLKNIEKIQNFIKAIGN